MNSSRWSYFWGSLALLLCPCHWPILALLLSGTMAGALLAAHWSVALPVALTLFGVAVILLVRSLKRPR